MATAKKSAAGAKKATAKKSSAKSASKSASKSAGRGGAAAAKKAPAKKAAAKGGAAKQAPAAKKAPAATKTAAKGGAAPKKRALNPALAAPMQPSGELAAVIGNKPMPRSEVAKQIWAYIKKNGLQDQTNKRNINADDNLKKVFGGKGQVSMFEMTALVSKHLKPA
jgi:chromatin remodeling complex protein RSC6